MLLVSNVPLPDPSEDPAAIVARHLGVPQSAVRSCLLVRKSLDARHRRQRWTGVFQAELADEAAVLRKGVQGVRLWNERDAGRYGIASPEVTRHARWPEHVRPIVVGTGPAGLYAALYLAEAGAPVRLFERGGPVDERVAAVNGHWRGQRPLDPENNLVFGEGGAGTFSDGKIYTRRRDGELGYIFRKLVQFGADPAVLQESWAHLGTDKIRALLPPFREHLQKLGVEMHFHTAVTKILVEDGVARGVQTADGREFTGAPVLVATGHSARDAVAMMLEAGAAAEPRGIAIGARIEHPQTLIDQGRYGEARGELPPATYRLAYHPKQGSPARTFCMCPGGVVVPASNHPERVVVNGMSFAARRAFWANSAVIVEVDPQIYGATDPMAGFRWQDEIEARAYRLGGGDYRAPAQRVVDLFAGKVSAELPRTSYPHGIVSTDLREVMPEEIVRGMIEALRVFDREVPGFAGEEAVLIAPETRTTSPVRFFRDERQQSTTVRGLFPIGEGAGYAGGIVSSALDGLRAAQAIAAEAGV